MFLIFILVFSFVYPVSSKEFQFDISSLVLKSGEGQFLNGVCYIPKLSSQQMYIYDDIHKIHFSDTKEVRERMVKQKKAYKNILRNNKLKTSGFADQIAEKYFRTKFNLSKRETSFFHAVFYKILRASQRESLLNCL